MRNLLTALLALTCFSGFAQITADSAIAVNAVGVQDVNFFPSTTTQSTCAQTITVNLPSGNWIYGVDLYYTINTVGGITGMPPAGIYAYLECTSTGTNEGQIYTGSVFSPGASENVVRSNLTFLNGVYSGSSLDFKLHAFDVAFFSSGCDTADAKIQAGTFKVVVHHGPAPTCLKPFNLGMDWAMHDRVALNWTSGGASNWQINYGSPGFSPGSGTWVNASANPFVLRGLSPNTLYEYYLRDSCGPGDVSLWEGPFQFRTICNPYVISTTYTEDFESATWINGGGGQNANNVIFHCWKRDPEAPTGGPGGGRYAWGTGNGSTPTANTGPGSAWLGSKYIYVEATGGQNQDVATITSPLIDVSSLTTPSLEFYFHRYGASVGGLEAQAWSQSTGWVTVWSKSGAQDQNSNFDPWIKESITLNAFANDTIKIRFRAVRSLQPEGDMAIDEVVIKEAPNCPDPSGFILNGRTNSSVTLIWNSANASNWQIEYGPNGFSQGAGTLQLVNSNPVIISGLSSGTVYDFYIRSLCGGGDTSGWIGPISAMPYCNALSAPYSENFDGGAWTPGTGTYNGGDALGPCWWRYPNPGTMASDPIFWGLRATSGSTPNTGPNQDHTGANFMYVESSAGFLGQEASLESPLVDISPLVNPELRFFYHMFGNSMGTLRVDVFRASNGQWTNGIWSISGQQQSNAVDPYLEAIVDLSAYAGDSIIIRFSGLKGNERRGDIAIDLVSIDEAPPCPQPSGLTSSNLGPNSVDLSWTSGGANQWQIIYGPNGFSIGSGLGTVVNAGSNPFTLLLSNSQVYDIYVRDSCGAGNVSAWVGPITVTMPCGMAVIPWSENFDGGDWTPGLPGSNNGNAISSCWSRPSFSNPNFGPWSGGTASSNTGPNADVSGTGKYLYTEASGASGPGSITSPQIYLNPIIANPTLKFHYHLYGSAIDSLYVEVNNGSGWTWIWGVQGQQQSSNGSAWTEIQYGLQNYSGDTVQIRFTGVNSGYTADMAIDEVSIEDVACPQSSNFAIQAVGSNAVDLSWSSAGSPGFNIEYGPAGFNLGSGTQVYAAASPFTLAGLSPATAYDFYLRDSCGATSYSAWLGPISATTLCLAYTAPHFENFDGGSWVVGVPTANNQGNQIDVCWTRPSDNNPNFGTNSGPTASANTGPLSDVSGSGKYLYTEFSGLSGYGEISSPEIYIPTSIVNPVLHFDYHLFGSNIDSLAVFLAKDGSSQWIGGIVGAQQGSSADAWKTHGIELDAWSGDTVRIIFRGYSQAYMGDISIDEFKLYDDPCPMPDNFSVGTITKNSISLSWTSGGANHWQIEYGPPGFSPGTGTLLSVSSNPYTITGLNASSYYEFYLRDSCNANDQSLWLGPLLGSTLCDTLLAPYYESFDLGFDRGSGAQNAGASISPCWNRNRDTLFFWGGGQGNTPSTGTGPTGDKTSGTGNYVYTEASAGSGGDTAILETGYIDLSALAQPELRFWYHMYSQNGQNLWFQWEIYSGGSWIILGSLAGDQGNLWQEQRHDLSNYLNQTVRFRFVVLKATGGSIYQSDVALDELVVDEKIACNPYTMPFLENFDGTAWQEGTGGLNDNDLIDPCWNRIATTQMRWGTGMGTTTSANTGPSSDLSGSGNYIYTEASRGATSAMISSPPIIVDTLIAAPHIFYHYHMYGATIVNMKVAIERSSGTTILQTYTGQQQNSSTAAWIADSIDITAYKGDTITLQFTAEATSFTGDIALDGIEVRDAILPCPDPTSLSISTISQTDFSLSWNSSNAPNSGILTYYDIASGPSTMQVITGINSPYTLTGLSANHSYAISIYDSCSVGQFSGSLFDTVSTLPCDTVTALFSVSTSYLGLSLDGSNSLNADTLIWDFGDGNGSGINPVNHHYANAGIYNVQLIALNHCGTSDTLVQAIRICDTLNPQMTFTVYSDSVLFDASGSMATSFHWDFGDGSTDTNRQSNHVYAQSGTYTVQLTVSNLCGDSVSISQSVQVCGAPKADWTYTVMSPINSGLRIQFDASASRNASTYDWDFGDGNTGTGVSPIHIYQTPGLFYIVKLKVTNACGNSHEWAWALFAIGLEEEVLMVPLKVYPNPVKDILTLEWDSEQWSLQALYLRDATGRLLMESHPQQSPLEWDLRHLPAGTYYLQVQDQHGLQSQVLIVKP